MRRQDDGSAFTGPIPGKPGIGDAVPAGGGKRIPRSRAATGLHSQALRPAARSWLTGVAGPRSRKRGPYAVQRHRRGAPRGALRFWSRFVGAPRPRHWRAEESAGERPAHPGPFKTTRAISHGCLTTEDAELDTAPPDEGSANPRASGGSAAAASYVCFGGRARCLAARARVDRKNKMAGRLARPSRRKTADRLTPRRPSASPRRCSRPSASW